mgnify:CR=1 FL=1
MRHLPHLLSGLSAVALLAASALPALAEAPAPAAVTAPAVSKAFTYQDMISANRLGEQIARIEGEAETTALLNEGGAAGNELDKELAARRSSMTICSWSARFRPCAAPA